MASEARKEALLPCRMTVAQSWAALRKCWHGFNIAKSQNNRGWMLEYACRIRKIQIQMGIKRTDFDQDILDENTVMLIDMKYGSQATLDQEVTNPEESRMESTELNYEELMTGLTNSVKMPDPRESIFNTHYPRSDKSCPSPALRPLAKIEKEAVCNNQSCTKDSPNPAEPTRIHDDTHIINYKNQCFEETGDQESTAISLDKARRFLEEAEAFSKKVLHEKACEDIPKSKYIFAAPLEQYLVDADQMESLKSIVHENKSCPRNEKMDQNKKKNAQPPKVQKKPIYYNESCPYVSTKQKYTYQTQDYNQPTQFNRQSHADSLNQDQNNFAAPDPNRPPVHPIFEDKARVKPAEDPTQNIGESAHPIPVHVIHKGQACPFDWSDSQIQARKKKQEPIRRKSKSCPYNSKL
jgi:hypothetical protein